MFQTLIFPTLLFISILFVIGAAGRRKNKRLKILFLLVGDLLCAVSLFEYPFPKDIGMAIPAVVVGILNLFAIYRIFAAEKPNQEQLNAWHDDPANWRAGIFYYNPQDKRLLPPKRIEGAGWTVNFANPYSVIMLAGILILAAILGFVLSKYKN